MVRLHELAWHLKAARVNENYRYRISHKLATSWPRSSISADAWIEELAELDGPRAEEAARHLVRTAEHAPSIAQFLAAYRATRGTADRYAFECPHCCNTGWVTDRDHPNHWPGELERVPPLNSDGSCNCNAVRPCQCDHGKAAGESWGSAAKRETARVGAVEHDPAAVAEMIRVTGKLTQKWSKK